jgi:hypothetical protein
LKNTRGGKEVDGVKLVDFKVSADFMKAKAAAASKKTGAKGKG